jgi:hypothetical protein
VTVPQHKDLKRLVRARMDETGENYTQALTALLSQTGLDTRRATGVAGCGSAP